MKLIRTISTTVLLLMAVLGLQAQEPLKVAKGARYPFRVDVVNKVASGNYYFNWSLNLKTGGERWNESGPGKNMVIVDFADVYVSDSDVLELQVSTKRENLCESDPRTLDIEIIDKPILEFDETKYGLYCSPSNYTTKDQLDFRVNLVGYWGDWTVEYVVTEGMNVVMRNELSVENSNFGEFSIVLDDYPYRNDDLFDKEYTVRLVAFRYDSSEGGSSVALPDLRQTQQIATFTVKPLVKIKEKAIKFKEIKK